MELAAKLAVGPRGKVHFQIGFGVLADSGMENILRGLDGHYIRPLPAVRYTSAPAKIAPALMPVQTTSCVALIAGPTGAVGKPLLKALLDSPRYAVVKALTRRPLGFSHPKLVEVPLAADGLGRLGLQLTADDVFCCLGTTLKAAGSKAAFERVDYHLVLELARAVKVLGATQFLVVSAAGSSDSSPSFYSRVKARMEQSVRELGFTSTQIIRPSLLLAERSESRPAEKLAMHLAPAFNVLLRGGLAKYRAVKVEDVANAMLTLAQREQAGAHVQHLPLV